MKCPTRYKSKAAEQAAKGYNAFLKRHGQPATTKWTKRPLGHEHEIIGKTIMQIHPDNDVQRAIVRLNDALCMWERSTGRQSVLILREEGGFKHRSMSGKPCVPDDVSDMRLLGPVSIPRSDDGLIGEIDT